MTKRIGIVGGGALGTLLARRFLKAGARVQILTRSAARRGALRREFPSPELTEDAVPFRGADAVFVCVKSYDTPGATEALRARVSPRTPVCSLQNGWGHMELLAEALPGVPLVAGATALGAYLDEEGSLRVSTAGMTLLAPWTGTAFAFAEEIVQSFRDAGLAAEARASAGATLWGKLALNSAVNPLTALLNASNGAVSDAPALLRIAEAAACEAVRVGARLGHLDPAYDPRPVLRDLLRDTRENRSSMAEDLSRGRRTEAEAIMGAVVRAARTLGEPVPVQEGLLHLVLAAEGRTADAPSAIRA
jgi:2-dehydropantoate 2-reductase